MQFVIILSDYYADKNQKQKINFFKQHTRKVELELRPFQSGRELFENTSHNTHTIRRQIENPERISVEIPQLMVAQMSREEVGIEL